MSDIHPVSQIRVIHSDRLDGKTPQTPGVIREVSFDGRNPDAAHLSAFRGTIQPGAATGAHHHGDQETVIYVISGKARLRWGDKLENAAEAGPGDFVLFIPAHVIHQEINASSEYETVVAAVRSGVDPIVVNLPELDEYAEPPAIDYTHP
ncbi:cupin domain-containing protein [Streptomyces xylophagus]|uniref:cupin domain-containing protein n=1 Tax=Streptomyces xylophagus TaxID=285514 RepID=UPI0005BAB106|nr:cupin domain-containing protein [Streptomyces xylophagus]